MQVSDLFFTIGETGQYSSGLETSISIGEFGNNGYGGEGYYKNNYREIHITKAYNYNPTMELFIFGIDNKNDNVTINFTYQPAYGGNTKYPFQVGENLNGFLKGDGKSKQFPSNKWGKMICNFGSATEAVYKKHNGIYTFKTTYKGKTYTSILHLKLSE
ncbi:hypothetical protein CDJ58_07950 [Campylobacter lari]|nr:hypothetical protein [Campylobacter lari]EAH8851017.1 hypothetical protein [Campylobacter lari]EAK5749316.1 hypothetical protein [Campylobacter lari]EAK9878386.1 hypothetical protein [Campylobacter lari]EAL0061774.1 hypothetical protein [Campylobacter lari]